MAQLLVRNLEDAVVERLREEAAREKISVEEAHRRVLRQALLPAAGGKPDLMQYLTQPPWVEFDDSVFERAKDSDRPIPDLTD